MSEGEEQLINILGKIFHTLKIFAVINSDERSKRVKKIIIEKKKLTSMYLKFLNTKQISPILEYIVVNIENKTFYCKIRKYSIINFIRANNLEVIQENIQLEEIENDCTLFLYFIEKMFENREFVRIKKMLSFAKEKKYFVKKYFDLKRRYKESVFKIK